jgi:hypothetical protein
MRTIILVCGIAVALSACDNSRQTAAATPQAAPAQESPATTPVVAVAAPEPPPQPTHNYVMEQDGEYGYQPGISEDEAKQGTAVEPLLMYRYRGKIGGAYTVEIIGDDDVTYRASCEDPCKFIKIRAIANGQTLKTETMANTDGSVINAVIEDAMSGQLKMYPQQ